MALRNAADLLGTRLGFGTNRLGALSARERQRLLDVVWDRGIHHFDTAPLYGCGDAERWLGDFLATGRSEVTVTTKCGLEPVLAGRFGALKAVARVVRRWSGPAGKLLNRAHRRMAESTNPPPQRRTVEGYRRIAAGLRASLEASLRRLRRSEVDVFAIHEPGAEIVQVEEIARELAAVKAGGLARWVAAAGYFDELFPIATSSASPFDLYQFQSGAHLGRWAEAGLPAPILFGALARDGARNTMPPAEVLRLALEENPGGMVLFSTSRRGHAEDLLRAVPSGILP